MAREILQYDCPVLDQDIHLEPVPDYGSYFICPSCKQQHRADRALGSAFRLTPGGPVDFTDEWAASRH